MASALKKKHILSVDDEADIRKLLEEALGMEGYRVTTTGNPREAEQIVRDDPPQLIIMDFQIEEGDGFVAINQIKKINPQTPIILLTGAAFDKKVVDETIMKI